jgi:hypothetical protein
MSMKSRSVTFAFAIVALTVLAGCKSSDSTSPSSPNTLDLSTLISEIGVGSGGVAGVMAVNGFPVTATPSLVPSSCQYSTSTQGFTCATVTSSGLTISATYFLLDAAGHFQSQPDAATTAAIRTVTDVSGTTKLDQTSASGSMTLTEHQDMTLSGLLTGAHLLNGTSAMHSDLTLTAPAAMHAVVDQKSTTANVALPKTGTSSVWPTSGTITNDGSTTTTIGSQPVVGTTHSVLTFNGSSTVTIATTITSGLVNISSTCTFDLAGASAPVCK